MFILLFTVGLGILFAVFATQNTHYIDITFWAFYIPRVPVYLVVLTPLLIGFVISAVYQLLLGLSRDLTINEQRDEIVKLKTKLAEEKKRAHKFELENVKIKKENEDFDEDSIQ